MKEEEEFLIFEAEEFEHFRSWLCLNVSEITWQGRYREDFETFWGLFFTPGISLAQLITRFEFAQKNCKAGTLSVWFNWLEEKFLIYIFIHFGKSVLELSRVGHTPVGEVARIIREFLVEKFPLLEEQISQLLAVTYEIDRNALIKYKDVRQNLNIREAINGKIEDDIMPTLEITLIAGWKEFLEKLKKEHGQNSKSLQSVLNYTSLKGQLRIVRDLIALLVLTFSLVWLVVYINSYFEKKLVSQIGLYQPELVWLKKDLKFRPQNVVSRKTRFDFEKNYENLFNEKQDEQIDLGPEARFETESEAVLTSWNTLPKNMAESSLKKSEYEEDLKGAYRDMRYGTRKVYRIMMRTADTLDSGAKLKGLIKRYQVEKSDHVRPGLPVPGGVYYNLFVPRKFLREFVAQVVNIEDSTLYESRTKYANPPGKNRVFIWIKSI